MIDVSKTQSYENVTNLRSTLLTSYNSDVLPVNNQSETLNINLTTYVFTISSVDQVQGAVTMGVMVAQEWFDEKLTWTPSDHNGITTISIKSEDVWTPPLTVSNPVEFTMLDKSWMQVMYMYNGKAMFTVGEIVKFTCTFYMKFWPYDKQICSLNLFVYGYTSSQLTLSVPGTVVNTDYYTENGEWYLDKNSFKYSTEDFFGATNIKYSFKLERLPAFYLLTVILPTNGIGALTCFVFLLPSESGERIGYSITILLSLAVFLTVVAMDLPKMSDPLPVMCLCVLFNMIVCVSALILVILNMVLYHRDDKVPISRFYKTLVRVSRFGCFENKVHDGKNKQATIFGARDSLVAKDNDEERPKRKDLISVQSCDRFEKPTDSDDEISWIEVSKAIDKLLFIAMVVLTYIPSVIILIYIAAASDYVA